MNFYDAFRLGANPHHEDNEGEERYGVANKVSLSSSSFAALVCFFFFFSHDDGPEKLPTRKFERETP